MHINMYSICKKNKLQHIFFLLYNHAKIMSNVYTLKDIKDRGGSKGAEH